MQAFRLLPSYETLPEIRGEIRQLMALPVLPPDNIRSVFGKMEERVPNELLPLYKYYRRFWIESVGPERCSVFGREIRTNNHLESWHAGFNKLVGRRHPNLFQLIDAIRKEQENSEQVQLQLAVGKTVIRSYPTYRNLNKRIEVLTEKFRAGSITDEHFSRAIGYCLADKVKFSGQRMGINYCYFSRN